VPECDWLADYYRRFEGYPVLFVLVECPLEELERREKARGDRQIGQARWHLQHP
jgi:chloramphenicol 3-O phosphotransferase